nr:GNAT family N-acetyltransferase [Streptomyces hoynatensis]
MERLSAAEFPAAAGELAGLLAEVVAGGSSLGFRTPFGRRPALDWWLSREPAVASGSLVVWVARGPEGVSGTISLAREHRENGRHRAEIVKLMVSPAARGRGLGRRLLATAEEAAAADGIRLLLLDTEADTPADRLYRAAGWTPYGLVPAYATDPGGALRDCTFFYKFLPEPPAAAAS